ncbi:major facilitator superfamily domain-containing protein 8-like [Eriocheir sinensis]|uniref:major facilitator superfamily domain-containing protein 8-like n=1 Tax=Eriocheir sinensis TaxID=95602 RepID=UPI0021CAB5C3|nr:major facilitator superfamily domain-containing protein 8-like [Eriocheir sinensis]
MGGTFGKSGSWVLDHTMDDIPLTPYNGNVKHGSIITGFEDPPPYAVDHLEEETEGEKRSRKRSHWVAYTTMFVMSIGFSIVLTGVWPYLHDLNPSLPKESISFVVAANPFGQMVASPLLGIWGNKAGKIRGACLTTVFFFAFGNIMYSLLALFEDMGDMGTYYAMIIARFIVGVSSANVTLCRSYLAQSTTVKERTAGIAIISAAQALGFVVGPGIQTLLIFLVPEEVDTGIWWLKWNKFTAPGWVAAALGFINLVVLMPCIFTEYNIAERERKLLNQNAKDDELLKLPKPDTLGIIVTLYGFFVTAFVYVLLETLAVPFVSDQYAWDDDKAMSIVGLALMGAGILATFLFPLSGKLGRIFDERLVLLFLGFVPILIGTFLFLPYPGQTIPMQNCENTTTSFTEITSPFTTVLDSWDTIPTSEPTFDEIPLFDYLSVFRQWSPLSAVVEESDEDCSPGCPDRQDWCYSVPQLPLAQLSVAFIIVMAGYPMAQSIAQGIFSKMLGPKPQGLWMGVLTGVGSLSRITGPIFVSFIYAKYGTYACFGGLLAMMIIAFIALVLMFKRLVPMEIPQSSTQHAYDGPAEKL